MFYSYCRKFKLCAQTKIVKKQKQLDKALLNMRVVFFAFVI
jgi:hypothetical protein